MHLKISWVRENWPEIFGLNDLPRAYEISVEKFTVI